MLSSYQRKMLERRQLRGKLHVQNMLILEKFGVLYIDNPPRSITLQEYKASVLKSVVYRMNRTIANTERTNAERACDIIKNGDKARFWNSRFSTSHAGSDMRGIVHHIRKYKPSLLSTTAD